MRRGSVSLILACLACGAVAVAGEAAGTGKVAGVITPAGKATKVGVVERIPATLMKAMDKDRDGKVDPKSGEYAVENLAPGKYDLFVETAQGRIEGVEIKVLGEENEPTFDLNLVTGELKVERFDIKPFLEENQVLTPEERDKLVRRKLRIDKLVEYAQKNLSVDRFEDTNRILLLHGTMKRAVGLVELSRLKAFYASGGNQAVWRIETWPYMWVNDVWHKPNKGARVWQRKRPPTEEFVKMGYIFDPALGGLEVKAGETAKFDYKLPDDFSKGLGKVPGAKKQEPAEK